MPSQQAPSSPLRTLGFAPLDPSLPNILLHAPQTPPSPNAPKLIILATWLGGATPARIAIYCRAYQALYPSSPILVIRTVLADITIKSSATIQAQLEPARGYIQEIFPSAGTNGVQQQSGSLKPDNGTLLHIFSHGGCNLALQLSRLLRSNARDVPFPIPLIGVILDSCPGSTAFIDSYSAATYSLPAVQPINMLGRAILFPFVGSIVALQNLGVISSIADMKIELNDLRTIGAAPRLYLHSANDKFVPEESVASHADELSRMGVSVRRETFKIAGHCALPAEDSQRYFDTIKSFVEQKQGLESKL